jgi:hypothetical protein
MIARMRLFVFALAGTTLLGFASARADDAKSPATEKKVSDVAAGESPMSSSGGKSSSSSSEPAHARILKDAKKIDGLLTFYQKGNNLWVELMPGDYSDEYIVLISISRGIAQGQLLGGMSWGFGDDWVWQFRKVDDNVHIVRRNVRFKATKGTPEARAVQNAYTDSVLFSLPATTKGPKGGDLVDLTSVFMSDLPQIGQQLPGFVFSSQKSSWASVKGFEKNMELQVAATYASSGQMQIETVPDTRGVTINVHYSISKIPTNGYSPRLADDRVGYFLTVVKDFSSKSDRDQFVRHINRWRLEKADPSAPLSPPKEPIVFWIEKTVPYKYRKAIYDGIYEWNKAFEKAGFVNAIEVRQQPDDADWDPEDVNYNTFRWITSNAGFAMGPSRVNPYTGQILDADIIFDADFLRYWKEEFETLTPKSVAAMTGGELDIQPGDKAADTSPTSFLHSSSRNPMLDCRLSKGMSAQLAFGASAIIAANGDPKVSAEELDKFIMQGLKEVTMHEVGHTLGLRHNFKGSKWLSLKDMADPSKTANGTVASVMDYCPAYIVPKDWKKGDYFTTTIGPYDYWAIEYGYKQFSGDEKEELKKIASRSGEPGLAYSTDEDTRGIDPDPDSNRFDLGSDSAEYAKTRAQIVKEMLPGLVERMTPEGDDYTQARRTFNILLAQYGQSMFFVSRQIGGLTTSRSHRGDKNGKPPAALIDAQTQRNALALLEENVFSEKPFDFPREIYNSLGWTHWDHWGMSRSSTRKDFPVHDFILMWQERMLEQMLSSVTLERMHDAELKASADTDVLTTAELLDRLTKSIFSEVETVKEGEFSNRKPAIASLRRNLQRSYLQSLSHLAMGNTAAPEDCQTVAYLKLSELQKKIDELLKNDKAKLDTYSKAHLLESSSRIAKVLDASLTLRTP